MPFVPSPELAAARAKLAESEAKLAAHLKAGEADPELAEVARIRVWHAKGKVRLNAAGDDIVVPDGCPADVAPTLAVREQIERFLAQDKQRPLPEPHYQSLHVKAFMRALGLSW